MCAYNNTWGLGTPTASQHIFDSEKLSQLFLELLAGFELGSSNLESNAQPTEPPRYPSCTAGQNYTSPSLSLSLSHTHILSSLTHPLLSHTSSPLSHTLSSLTHTLTTHTSSLSLGLLDLKQSINQSISLSHTQTTHTLMRTHTFQSLERSHMDKAGVAKAD